METEKYQKELFEFESPKKPAARFGNIFPKTDFAIVLTPEKIVFTAIGIIMLMVVFFALGVEKGKSTVYSKAIPQAKAIAKDMVVAPVAPVKPAQVPVPSTTIKNSAATNITPKISMPQPIVAAKTQNNFDRTKPYTIVAGAFSKEDLAIKEVAKLKAAGLDGFIYYGEPYYLACVGSFQSKDSAQKILNKVKQMHKDAYVRIRQ